MIVFFLITGGEMPRLDFFGWGSKIIKLSVEDAPNQSKQQKEIIDLRDPKVMDCTKLAMWYKSLS